MNLLQARNPVPLLLSDPSAPPINAVTSSPIKNASGTAISSDSIPNMKLRTMSPPSAMKKVVMTKNAAASAARIDSA